jgi:outer membrane assembly lipoprotein YfiO
MLWPRNVLVVLLAASLLFSACSEKLSRRTGLTDRDLLSGGEQKLARKKPGDAVEHFRLLMERFPNSPLAPRAQLLLADAYMENGDNAEAEVAFDDFLRLYPANDNVPYALSRKGELLYRHVLDPRRDQTKTREAIRTYALLQKKSPSGPYAASASAHIAELRNRLARHEAQVVTHYLARKEYSSAEARARRAIAEYPDTGTLPSLLALLAESLEGEKKPTDAAEVRKSLSEKFPDFGAKKQ